MPLTIRIDGDTGPETTEVDEEDKATRVLSQEPAHVARRCPACDQVFSGDARFCPFDGDALVLAPDWNPQADALIGQSIAARYEVTGVLGEGGMGTIYAVRHLALGRRFALKVLRRDVAQDPELVARFIQEAKAAAAVGHPNIVAVIDFGELPPEQAPGRGRKPVPFFVMEHLTGTSLALLLRHERTLEPRRAARIFLQCTSGLAAAHAAGVVHRDLKPDNVFLTGAVGEEFVKLLDFGVAKIAGAGRLTRAGTVFGTPHYMSPEQAAGHEVDQRADVYALGVIMYECFAGRVPFEADTYMGVLTKHMFAEVEPLERVAPDPARLGALAPVVMRCLAKDLGERYADMIEVGGALEAALAALGDGPGEGDADSEGKAPTRRLPSGRPQERPGTGAMRLRDPVLPEPASPSLPPVAGIAAPSAKLVVALALVATCALVALVFALRVATRARSGDAEATRAQAQGGPSVVASAAPPESASARAPEEPSAVSPTASVGTAGAGVARPASSAKPAAGKGRPARDLVDPWAR